MAKRIRPIGHEDRLSLVEHLDELRTRIVISLATFGVALGFAFWQNHALLKFAARGLQLSQGRFVCRDFSAQPFVRLPQLSRPSEQVGEQGGDHRFTRAFPRPRGFSAIGPSIAGSNGALREPRPEPAAAAPLLHLTQSWNLIAAWALPWRPAAIPLPLVLGRPSQA